MIEFVCQAYRSVMRTIPSGIVACLVLISMASQATEPEFIEHNNTFDRFIKIPAPSAIKTGQWKIGDVQVQVSRTATSIRVMASVGKKKRVRYIPLNTPHLRLVFDKRQYHFFALHPSIRVSTTEPVEVDQLRSALGGLDADRYPVLGYSVIKLPKSVDPVAAAAQARNLVSLEFAEIVLVRPRDEPL